MTIIKYMWHAKCFVNVNDKHMTTLLTEQFLQICLHVMYKCIYNSTSE